jgi:hypothetical protein
MREKLRLRWTATMLGGVEAGLPEAARLSRGAVPADIRLRLLGSVLRRALGGHAARLEEHARRQRERREFEGVSAALFDTFPGLRDADLGDPQLRALKQLLRPLLRPVLVALLPNAAMTELVMEGKRAARERIERAAATGPQGNSGGAALDAALRSAFSRACLGGAVGSAGGLGARAEEVDLLEFLSFLDEVGVTPWRMTRPEGTRIFLNVAGSGCGGRGSGNGLDFGGFCAALDGVAQYLGKPVALLLRILLPPSTADS